MRFAVKVKIIGRERKEGKPATSTVHKRNFDYVIEPPRSTRDISQDF